MDPGLIMLPDYAMYNVIGMLDPWLNYATYIFVTVPGTVDPGLIYAT